MVRKIRECAVQLFQSPHAPPRGGPASFASVDGALNLAVFRSEGEGASAVYAPAYLGNGTGVSQVDGQPFDVSLALRMMAGDGVAGALSERMGSGVQALRRGAVLLVSTDYADVANRQALLMDGRHAPLPERNLDGEPLAAEDFLPPDALPLAALPVDWTGAPGVGGSSNRDALLRRDAVDAVLLDEKGDVDRVLLRNGGVVRLRADADRNVHEICARLGGTDQWLVPPERVLAAEDDGGKCAALLRKGGVFGVSASPERGVWLLRGGKRLLFSQRSGGVDALEWAERHLELQTSCSGPGAKKHLFDGSRLSAVHATGDGFSAAYSDGHAVLHRFDADSLNIGDLQKRLSLTVGDAKAGGVLHADPEHVGGVTLSDAFRASYALGRGMGMRVDCGVHFNAAVDQLRTALKPKAKRRPRSGPSAP